MLILPCTIHESQSHTFTKYISLPSPWTATSIFHISACLNVNCTLVTCVQMLWPPPCIKHIVFQHTPFITFSLLWDTYVLSVCLNVNFMHNGSCISVLNAYFDHHRAPDTIVFVLQCLGTHVLVCLFWTTSEYKRENRSALSILVKLPTTTTVKLIPQFTLPRWL